MKNSMNFNPSSFIFLFADTIERLTKASQGTHATFLTFIFLDLCF